MSTSEQSDDSDITKDLTVGSQVLIINSDNHKTYMQNIATVSSHYVTTNCGLVFDLRTGSRIVNSKYYIPVGYLNRIVSSDGSQIEKTDEAQVEPAHYSTGKMEPWKFIADQQLNFNLGNVVKYVVRAGKKPGSSYLRDLEKAVSYLKMEIELNTYKQGNAE